MTGVLLAASTNPEPMGRPFALAPAWPMRWGLLRKPPSTPSTSAVTIIFGAARR